VFAEPADDGDGDAVADNLESAGFGSGQPIVVVKAHEARGLAGGDGAEADVAVFGDKQKLFR
jgi:hypothetical protein